MDSETGEDGFYAKRFKHHDYCHQNDSILIYLFIRYPSYTLFCHDVDDFQIFTFVYIGSGLISNF